MATKRGGGDLGDLIDKVQAHNRNVALAKQADAAIKQRRAAEEQARQARLDRQANDRHRAQLEAIEAERLKILREEQKAKEFAKRQNNLVYDISCQLKKLDADFAPTPEKIRQLYKLNADFENIVPDAITDLQYKNLYSETQNLWRRLLDNFRTEHADDFATYQKYCALEQKVESYNFKISSTHEMVKAQHLVGELKNFSWEHPELAPHEDEIGLVQKSVSDFIKTVATMRGLWETLNAKKKITSNATFVFLLCSYFEVKEDVFRSNPWLQSNNNNCSRDTINRFCDFCLKAMETNSSLSDTVLQIFDSVENPQTIPAIQATRKKQQVDKNTANCCLGCLVFISLVLFLPPALIITIKACRYLFGKI